MKPRPSESNENAPSMQKDSASKGRLFYPERKEGLRNARLNSQKYQSLNQSRPDLDGRGRRNRNSDDLQLRKVNQ